jgi:hypothetical protein
MSARWQDLIVQIPSAFQFCVTGKCRIASLVLYLFLCIPSISSIQLTIQNKYPLTNCFKIVWFSSSSEIPQFRLPYDAVSFEIELVKDLGVKVNTLSLL